MAKDTKAAKGAEGTPEGAGVPGDAPAGSQQIDGLAPPAGSQSGVQTARIAELEGEVKRLTEQLASASDAAGEQLRQIERLEHDLESVLTVPSAQAASAPPSVDDPLNVVFTQAARKAERSGDHAGYARLSEIAIAAGNLRHKVGDARGQIKGELGQIIEHLYRAL